MKRAASTALLAAWLLAPSCAIPDLPVLTDAGGDAGHAAGHADGSPDGAAGGADTGTHEGDATSGQDATPGDDATIEAGEGDAAGASDDGGVDGEGGCVPEASVCAVGPDGGCRTQSRREQRRGLGCARFLRRLGVRGWRVRGGLRPGVDAVLTR